jgi:hypothetical protein
VGEGAGAAVARSAKLRGTRRDRGGIRVRGREGAHHGNAGMVRAVPIGVVVSEETLAAWFAESTATRVGRLSGGSVASFAKERVHAGSSN